MNKAIGDDSICFANLSELDDVFSNLIEKQSGRLFMIISSQGCSSQDTTKKYQAEEHDELLINFSQLIERGECSIAMSTSKDSFRIPYSRIFYSYNIEEQKQKAKDFISKYNQEPITLSYEELTKISDNYDPEKNETGHSIALDISLKDDVLSVISYNPGTYPTAIDSNYINMISVIKTSIQKQVNDENILSGVILPLGLGTLIMGIDCKLHSWYFADTAKKK